MRKHIYHLAEKLAVATGLNTDHIYDFLMACGKDLGKDPSKLTWITGSGILFLEGRRDDYCLEVFIPTTQPPAYDGPDYEALILARQEAWMD